MVSASHHHFLAPFYHFSKFNLTFFKLSSKPLQTLTSLNEHSQTPISAFCSCKGGADGFCRLIIATLFEIESYVNDPNQRSVTSGPCLWNQKGNKSSQPLPVVELQMDIAKHEIHHLHTEQQYNPVPENIPLLDPEQFIQILWNHLPKSCMLDLHRVKVINRTKSLPCKFRHNGGK